MKLIKKLIGQSYPVLKLPKDSEKKGYDLVVGQFYEVVDIKVKKLTILDDSGNEVSVYATTMNFENSLTDKEARKQEFEDKNFGFDWVSDNLNVVFPEEYAEATDEDGIKEMGWLIKADAYINKGAEMKPEQIELMLDFLKRKNKVKEYQDVLFEIDKRKNNITSTIDELLG